MTDVRRSAAAILAAACAALSAPGAAPADHPVPAATSRLQVAWSALNDGRYMSAYRHF
jgi:hypothetical protein